MAHELLQLVERGLLARQQILLVAAAVVELVEPQRLVDECQCLFFLVEFAQDGRLQGAGLVVVPVADETAVELVEGILVTALQHADLRSLEIASIGPGLVPSGLPETLVGLGGLALVLQRQAEVIDGLAVVGIRIALLE